MVPPTTLSFLRLGCGSDSPVIIDSFTADSPKSTVPSTGICAPGSTLTTSPLRRPETGTSVASRSISLHEASCRAVGGTSVSSCVIAFDAFPLAADSRYLPSKMKVISTAAVSKNSWSSPSSPRVPIETNMKMIE